MCVAIVKPAGKLLDYEDMVSAWLENPDGIGFTVRQSTQLYTHKGVYTNFDDFWSIWEAYEHLEALVHFRFATAGTVNQENCHPFTVAKAYSVIHNGHFKGYGSKEVSDTRQWLFAVLEPLLLRYPRMLEDSILMRLIENSIGDSKVAILGPTGGSVILNESDEDWENGIWYSNVYYRYSQATDNCTLNDWGIDDQDMYCQYCGETVVDTDVCEFCWQYKNNGYINANI